jgi:hypothetical protein
LWQQILLATLAEGCATLRLTVDRLQERGMGHGGWVRSRMVKVRHAHQLHVPDCSMRPQPVMPGVMLFKASIATAFIWIDKLIKGLEYHA